jgi:hypothetical protein
MNKWLARLSYSLIIIAAVLLWEANKLGAGRRGRATVYWAAAAVCTVLGAMGVRARHRPGE